MGKKLDAALQEARDIENDPDRVARTDVKVSRGYGRSKVLQTRLNDAEWNEVEALAAEQGDGGVPMGTMSRALILEALEARRARATAAAAMIDPQALVVQMDQLQELMRESFVHLAERVHEPVPNVLGESRSVS